MKKFFTILLLVSTLFLINPIIGYCYWTEGWSDFWDWITTDPYEDPCPE